MACFNHFCELFLCKHPVCTNDGSIIILVFISIIKIIAKAQKKISNACLGENSSSVSLEKSENNTSFFLHNMYDLTGGKRQAWNNWDITSMTPSQEITSCLLIQIFTFEILYDCAMTWADQYLPGCHLQVCFIVSCIFHLESSISKVR